MDFHERGCTCGSKSRVPHAQSAEERASRQAPSNAGATIRGANPTFSEQRQARGIRQSLIGESAKRIVRKAE